MLLFKKMVSILSYLLALIHINRFKKGGGSHSTVFFSFVNFASAACACVYSFSVFNCVIICNQCQKLVWRSEGVAAASDCFINIAQVPP